MFDINTFMYAREIRVLVDVLHESSGDDSVESAIDSVPGAVAEVALRLGVDNITAQLLGRHWALEIFYGYSMDGDRYIDAPEYQKVCREVAQEQLDELRASADVGPINHILQRNFDEDYAELIEYAKGEVE